LTYLLRHLLAILILPTTIIVVIPVWIGRRFDVDASRPVTWLDWAAASAGIVIIGIGLALFAASLRHFASEGRGTLAPWDPPRHLVIRGPYRYVRNPMISGVMFMVFGLALVLRSIPHGIWAVVFAAQNLLWIPFVEEPQLERRFGEAYRTYRAHVPRFVPLARPWSSSILVALFISCTVAAQSKSPVRSGNGGPHLLGCAFIDPQSDVWPQVLRSVRRLLALPD
jgi:protein-S-isoprenylcysteine O-methyltransferase Ste14